MNAFQVLKLFGLVVDMLRTAILIRPYLSHPRSHLINLNPSLFARKESPFKLTWRKMASFAPERFFADRDAPLCSLNVAKSFEQLRYMMFCIFLAFFLMKHLSSKEKKYAHYLSEASWAGARIIQGQQTPQAQDLYDLLISTFSDGKGKLCDLEALRAHADLGEEEWKDLLEYTIQVGIRQWLIRLFVIEILNVFLLSGVE
jgi:dipeptidyl-peptidase-3